MAITVASVLIPLALKKATNMYGHCLNSNTPGRCLIKRRLDNSIPYRVITKRERPVEAAANIIDQDLTELGLTNADLKGVGKLITDRAKKK